MKRRTRMLLLATLILGIALGIVSSQEAAALTSGDIDYQQTDYYLLGQSTPYTSTWAEVTLTLVKPDETVYGTKDLRVYRACDTCTYGLNAIGWTSVPHEAGTWKLWVTPKAVDGTYVKGFSDIMVLSFTHTSGARDIDGHKYLVWSSAESAFYGDLIYDNN